MDLVGSETASALADDVENSDQNKMAFTDEQITTNILSIAQLAVDGSIPVLDAVTKLKQNLNEVVAIGMTKDKWKSLYASVIWILGTQISPTSQEEEHPRKNFIDLVKDSIAHDLADSSLLKATLELSTLVLLGLIKDEEGHQKRLIKLNTGVVYKQQKYNLEREETEGYSKLVVLLQSMPLPPANIDSIIQSVLAVIGQFDLEPNRVLDVILDCFEQQPHNLSFIALLKQFKIANIVHIVGFKFTHYQSSGKESSNKHATGFEIVPETLCLLAATLIAQQLIDLDSLLPYLTPSLEETAQSLKIKEDAVRKNLASISGLNEFLSHSGSPGNSLDATTPAATTVGTTEQPGGTIGPNLPSDAFFLQQPLRQRAGSSYKRVVNSKLLPNPPANASTGLLKSVLSSKLITVTSSSNVGAAATPTANTPSLGISRAQRDKDKETKEKERIQELEVEEKDLSGQLLLFDRSQMYATDDADVRRYPVLTLATCLLQVRCLSLAQTLIRSLSAESGVTLDFLMVFSKGLRDSMVSLAQYVVQPVVNELRRLPCLGGSQNSFITNRVEVIGNPFLVSTLTDTSFLPELLESFLKPMSYHIATSTQMFISLATLFKQFIEQHREKLWSFAEKRAREVNLPDSEETKCFATANMMAQQLLLALSTTGADATFASGQLWRGLSMLPHTLRFAIYDEHRRVLLQALNSSPANIQNMPLGVVLAAKIANKDIKNELKRLTKDNPKPTSIKLAKLLQSHSVIASTAFLSLVENFDNFIPYCIDALRTLSEGARDIFAHAFLTELSEKESQRNDAEASQEGRSSPSWFLSLAKFIACFYGRYPSTELRGLLSYMLQSLADGRVGDLVLVKELVSIMGGCEVLRELSTVQLEGLAGGKVLRAEVLGVLGATSAVTPAGTSAGVLLSQQRRAATTLRDTLLNTQTALPLFLFMARLRAKAITDEGIDQLKVASSLADSAQDLLLQLSDFLVLDAHGSNGSNNNSNNVNSTSNTSTKKTIESVAKTLPPVPTLLNDLQLSPNLAFQLVRPLFRHSLSQQNIGVVNGQQSWTLFSEEVRLSLINWLDTQYNNLFGDDLEETDEENVIDEDTLADTEISKCDKQWKNEVRRWWQWTDKGEDDLLKLYLWFWGLGLSDIHHPQDRYNAELKRIQDKLNDLETKKQNASAATLNLSSSEFKKWQKQRDTEMLPLKNAIVSLTDESQYQKTHVETMTRMLCEDKERFIPRTWQERNQPTHIANWLLQELVLPRVTLGASEAVYAIKFLRHLHDCGVQGVHILCVVDALLYRLLSLVYCCTEHEASCIGYALQEIWWFVTRWQRSMQLYDTEVKSKLAICCPSLVPLPLSAASSSAQSTTQNHSKSTAVTSMSETDRHVLVLQAGVSYTKFLSLCRLWQGLLLQTLLTCLSTTEYMYIRCGMTLVSRLVEQFPSKRSDGQTLLAAVEKLAAQDEKKDLQLMARSLAVRLKKQSSNWANDIPQATSTASAVSTDKKLKPSASQTILPSASTSQTTNTNKNLNNSSNRNSSLSNSKSNNSNNNNRINNDSKVSSASASKPPPPPPASANSNSNTSGLSLKDRLIVNGNNNQNNNLSGNKRDRDNNNNRDNKNANNANTFSSSNNNRDRDYRGGRDSRNRDNVNNSATPSTKDADNKDKDSVSLMRETGNKRKADDNNASNINSNNNNTSVTANTGNKVARTEFDKDVRSKQDREKTNSVNNNGATNNNNNANMSNKTTSNNTTSNKTSTAPVNPPRPQAMRGNSQSREISNSNNSRNNTNTNISSRNNNSNVRNSGHSSVNQPPPPPANPPPPPRQSSVGNNSYSNHRDNFSRDNRAQPPPPPNRDQRGVSDHYNVPQQPPPPKQQPPSHQQYHQQQSQQSSNMSGYPPNKRTRR